ncbi:hypothetical protein L798_08008 [Zootermopsis nevadensis]|uniref:Cuticle protein 6 n=2 Tax=Zootermopsis nevadensis TaxID=136037 RepID=A0A067RGC3_ZOONE|nr:hypothetical protein L798_08008 [Zootermopsis nevadensis]
MTSWSCAVVKATGDQEESPEEQEAQSQQQVAILKQINRVNDDGSYTFGYEAADGSFKIETRDVQGNVKGMFGFVDESGELKRVSYSASNNTGFQSKGSLSTVTETERNQELSTRSAPLLYQQVVGPQVTTRRTPLVHDSLTTTRRPILLYAQNLTPAGVSESPEPSTRSSVIQVIAKSRRPTEVPSSTEKPLGSATTRRPLQLYGQYIRQQPGTPGGEPVKQIFVTPAAVNEAAERVETTSPRPTGVVYGHYIRPTQPVDSATPSGQLLRRIVLARKPPDVTESPTATLHSKQPQESKDSTEEGRHAKGNTLRRQLAQDRGLNYNPGVQLPPQFLRARQSGSDDTGDVYGGSMGGSPRPISAIPFKPGFTPAQSRGVLQSQFIQDIAGTRQRPGYPQDDIPPGAIPSNTGGAVRIPLGVIREGVLDPRIPPAAFEYSGPGYQYTPPGPDPDLHDQLLQYLLGRQQPRHPTYVNDYQYRQESSVPPLTPFQIALMMTLGNNIPPELLDDPYQVNRQQQAYGPQQPQYNRQNIPYPISYPQQVPYVNPYPPQQGPYGQQTPYNQALPYDPQLYQRPYQSPNPYPSQIPYHLRRRLLYRPQQVYTQQLPFANDQSVPPDYYQQPLPYPGRNQQVGYPQDFLPDEYRDALILRMLLAVRAAQQGRIQHRPVEQNPNIQERSQPYSTTTTTTVRPRSHVPVRNVQILDPVTEETTAKRSTDGPSRS